MVVGAVVKIPTAGARNLILSARPREGNNVDLGPARLIREISQAVTVRRKLAVVLVSRRRSRLERLAVAEQRKDPSLRAPVLTVKGLVRDVAPVGRPILPGATTFPASRSSRTLLPLG